ncbi:unnamed protein product, partial [Rotaria magnacalcarata]
MIWTPESSSWGIQVAIMLKKLFAGNRIPIKELSMCVQAGERRLKFAVDINQDTARQQILKTIPATVGFSSIHYHHRQRPSYDILFTVRSLEQYQTALELGRLSIGQHYLPFTTLLIGYRLTYCTACWKIGHMRDKCQSPVSCCKCLDPYTNGVKHSCQDIFNCAQCGGNHYSLDSICPAVKKSAIERSGPGEISRPFQQHANDFPLLNQAKEMSDLVVTIKALSETMIPTEKSFNDLNNRIEVQHKSTILDCNSICVIIDTVQVMSSWVREVMDLIFKVGSPVCVFTEVGELWNSFKVPNFTSFYQKGTNHSGEVMITIGKHLRATRIDTDIENTVIVVIHGLSEQIIIIGDFNATSDEWGSQSTDRR